MGAGSKATVVTEGGCHRRGRREPRVGQRAPGVSREASTMRSVSDAVGTRNLRECSEFMSTALNSPPRRRIPSGPQPQCWRIHESACNSGTEDRPERSTGGPLSALTFRARAAMFYPQLRKRSRVIRRMALSVPRPRFTPPTTVCRARRTLHEASSDRGWKHSVVHF